MNQLTPEQLIQLDHEHVWHPFTPMTQWRKKQQLIIDRAQGSHLIDTAGRRYIDGVSSLWCNVHGHCVEAIDQAIRDQLDRVAHTTLLGLASGPSIELAARLVRLAPGKLNKIFYSDAGATAVEVALKMAVGYWFHNGQPKKTGIVAWRGAYHGDTAGSMSIGFSELFHRPFRSMTFPVHFIIAPNACHEPISNDAQPEAGENSKADADRAHRWPSEDDILTTVVKQRSLDQLDRYLQQHASETAAVVIEPLMQGAAGMICQPQGFLRGVSQLAAKHNVLLIADEVATGFGRTGKMFACQHEAVEPDIMCLAKGISAGYLPLAATLTTDQVEQAFCGSTAQSRTFFHGHTYTGNALACAAANASLDLFEGNQLLDHINSSATIITERLHVLRNPKDYPHVVDVRQRGLMVGIELGKNRHTRQPFDFSAQKAAALCLEMRDKGLIIRPLGDVVVLMPICAMPHDTLHEMLDIVVESLGKLNPDISYVSLSSG